MSGNPTGMLIALDQRLQILARGRVLLIQNDFRQLAARRRLELQQTHSAIQEHRTPGHAIHHAVLDQHAAGHRPHRLDLLEGGHPADLRRGLETPGQGAVRSAQAINAAIRRAKVEATLMEAGRRIHAAAGHEAPQQPPVFQVEGADFVRFHLGDEQLAVRHDRGGEFAAQGRLPCRVSESVGTAVRVKPLRAPSCR